MDRKILFVCTGNTCRSPMAEGLFKQIVFRKERLGLEAMSAGIAATNGAQATSEAVEVMLEEGVNLSKHRSHALTEGMAREADLILCMTLSQKQFILAQFPYLGPKVHLLKQYAGVISGNLEVQDPVGSGLQAYRHCVEELKLSLEKIEEKLENA